MTFKIILECGEVCKTSMGILFKLLCPGDVPAKAHKIILNYTTSLKFEEVCLEKHYVHMVYDLWKVDMEIVDNTTNRLIEYSAHWERIWGEYDRMTFDWEVLLRKFLLNYCIFSMTIPKMKYFQSEKFSKISFPGIYSYHTFYKLRFFF